MDSIVRVTQSSLCGNAFERSQEVSKSCAFLMRAFDEFWNVVAERYTETSGTRENDIVLLQQPFH